MKAKQRKSPRSILLLIDLSNASGREYLTGISQWARLHTHWNIRLVQPNDALPAEFLSDDLPQPVDGMICAEARAPELADALRKTRLPLVVIGDREDWIRERTANIAFVRDDDEYVGKMIVRHFLDEGNFASFGFVPNDKPFYWSRIRQESFCRAARQHGRTANVFNVSNPAGSQEDMLSLRAWLADLPKPAAVMAAYDRRAMDVLAAAHEEQIDVPRQLAVIGVDNDETICDLTDPPLSSVSIDHIHVGELAASALSNLLRQQSCESVTMRLMKRIKLVQRVSDAPVPPATRLVNDALTFIRDNAFRGITARDVVTHLRVSRRLADLRFRQLQGTTISRKILETRLAKVKRQLLNTRLPIRAITESCGFADEFHAKKVFRREFGVTMRDFRRSGSNVSSPRRHNP